MAEIKWKKKKEVTAAISKNIYFSLQNPQERSGKAGRGGEGGGQRQKEFTGLLRVAGLECASPRRFGHRNMI